MGKDDGADFAHLSAEARKHVWMGAIPLLVHLHESEITSLPAPSSYLVLAPRNGYLPLLVDSIKPHFQSTLLPGSDTIWFDYEGLPLKWHIPTGVLFDLLCAEPERPWNLTVHFRAYPSDVLSPCEDEDSVKWNFVNALKEASYVMYGSTKSVMNLSQLEQTELWKSVVKGDLENYDHVFGRLKAGRNFNASAPWNLERTISQRPTSAESETEGKATSRGAEGGRPVRLPMRVYIRFVKENFDDLDDCPPVDSWEQLIYITRPIDIPKDKVLTLRDALLKVVPHLFSSPPSPASNQADSLGKSTRDSVQSDPAKVNEASDEGSEHEKVESSDEPVESAPTPSDEVQTAESPESSRSNDVVNQEESRLNGQDARDGEITESSLEERNTPQASDGDLCEGLCAESTKQFQGIVRIQGIEPNLDLPLDWVARNLSGPEMFVHLCIRTWVTG
ncbi:hypothetical protein R1flu_020413 [Riccia fluitans]|uniref:Autophagy protein 5 n=1 Tax=Riccia fluitans TaxID=41844 RepID=A0ABD1ZLT8_9MARC